MDIKIAKIRRVTIGTLELYDTDDDVVGVLTFWLAGRSTSDKRADEAVTWVHDALNWRASIEDVSSVGDKIALALDIERNVPATAVAGDPAHASLRGEPLEKAARMATAVGEDEVYSATETGEELYSADRAEYTFEAKAPAWFAWVSVAFWAVIVAVVVAWVQ